MTVDDAATDIAAPSVDRSPLHLDAATWRRVLELMGPSLGLWRAAEIAALREQSYEPPVLDLGCGDGLVAAQVLSHVEIGLDPNTQALSRAARTGIYQRLVAEHMEAADIPAGSIRTVVSNSVLEHVPRIDEALAAVARVLRPGGRLILTAPTEAFSRQLALPLAPYAAWRNRHLAHLNLWPVEEWTRRLERAGLEVIAVRSYLRPRLVWTWDALDLLQQPRLRGRQLFSLGWRRLSPAALDRLSERVARLDLSSPAPGGGRLIAARKR